MKKSLNNKGSILHIVLIVFLVVLVIISISTSLLILKVRSYHDIDLLMKQKDLEVMLVRYYLDTIDNDMLMSDSIESEDYNVRYYVDDMGSYIMITTYIEIKDSRYQFQLNVNSENHDVEKIEYMEG